MSDSILNKYENVPHGTNLEIYYNELLKWQKSINLIGNSTLEGLWKRHFVDSLQIIPLVPTSSRTLIDLGTGAGFPGLVLALTTPLTVTLVDSDHKKCEFLKHIARETASNVIIQCARLEKLDNQSYDIITARAFASVSEILSFARKFVHKNSLVILLKGEKVEDEIAEAKKTWHFKFEISKSLTSNKGKILIIRDLHDKSLCCR